MNTKKNSSESRQRNVDDLRRRQFGCHILYICSTLYSVNNHTPIPYTSSTYVVSTSKVPTYVDEMKRNFCYCHLYGCGTLWSSDVLTPITLLFYQIEPYRKGPFLVLPSSIAKNSSAPNAKRIFQIHRGILEGCTNRARPSQPSLKNCQNGTF